MLGSLVWLVPAAFAILREIVGPVLAGDKARSLREILWAGGDWAVYGIIAPAIFVAVDRWPLVRPHIARRIPLHVLFAFLASIAWAFSGKLLEFALGALLSPAELSKLIADAQGQFLANAGRDLFGWILVTLPFGAVVYICVAGIAHATRYFSIAQAREAEVARIAEQIAGARLSALQAQLNPQFVFSALGAIADRARAGDGPGSARIVEHLSEVLRRTLSRHRANEVPLDDEIELARQYLAIEQARMPNRLSAEFAVDQRAGAAALPGFALQQLVENAVRHGIAPRGAGTVRIAARAAGDMLEVTVSDDGPGIADGTEFPAGHGIANLRERLTALYGDRASLIVARADMGGTIATLRVPYRELPLEADLGER